ncbi:hypothetical protein D3C87_1240560 [compost metagenome]
MSTPIWFERFSTKLHSLEEDYASSGSKVSILAYAFQTARLNPEDYLAWAVNHYQLPKLSSRFFVETPPSQEVFAKWATHFLWNMECLPVAEWDGSLIVACLEPPQDFSNSVNAIFVLTSLDDLTYLWNIYHEEKELDIPQSGTPEGMDLSLATVVHSNKSDSFSFEDLGMDSSDSSDELLSDTDTNSGVETSEEEPIVEALEGLNFDAPTTLIKLEPFGQSTTIGSSPEHTPDLTSSEETAASTLEKTTIFKPLTAVAPAPVASAAPSAKKAPQQQEPLLLVDEPLVLSEAKPIPPPPQKKMDEEKTTIAPAVAKVPAAPAAAKIPPAAEAIPAAPIAKPKPAPVPAAAAIRSSMNTGMDMTLLLEVLKKKNGTAIDDRVKTTFTEMRNHFEKTMILTLDEKESQLVAFAWDDNFKGMKDPTIRVPLRVPSIFNIVASTQKSFHGYISLNEVNEKFFEDWNQGRIPDHVTIAPLIVEDKMVGMIMGFAEKSAYNKMSLNLAEKLSNEFVKNLKTA